MSNVTQFFDFGHWTLDYETYLPRHRHIHGRSFNRL
jgi:hypothetical protein